MIRSLILNKYVAKEFTKVVINITLLFFCFGFIINLFEEIIIKTLLSQLKKVINKTNIQRIVIVGGVAANKRFRTLAKNMMLEEQLKIIFPPLEYCTDNAAMIGIVGYLKYKNREISDLSCSSTSRYKI